ncbi:MAG: hypothetical protein OIN83_09945 [Candidatus Methanoperedens sp.]|nr:hypothetical protein [Candidatus Methanoperedens sp.]
MHLTFFLAWNLHPDCISPGFGFTTTLETTGSNAIALTESIGS